MAWIKEIVPEQLEVLGEKERAEKAELQELFDRARDPVSGEVDNILSVHSLHPSGLKAHLDLYQSAMAGTRSLRKVDREMIALVVSKINQCHY